MIAIIGGGYKIAIEKIKKEKSVETSLFFMETLSDIKSLQRKYEKYYTIKLLDYLSGGRATLSYKGKKPVIGNLPLNISISHTKERVAVALSSSPTGLDMEIINNRALKIASRFINEKDTMFIDPDDAKDTTLLWTAKEAVYKLDNSLVNFKNDIQITGLHKISKFKGKINLNGTFTAEYFIFENFIITLATKL